MLNDTASLTGDALASVTNNSYSAYNLVDGWASIVGAVGLLTMIVFISLYPKSTWKIVVGYIGIGLIECCLFGMYVVWMSSDKIITALWDEILYKFGIFIIDYFGYILVSIPLAWFVGDRLEKMQPEEKKE